MRHYEIGRHIADNSVKAGEHNYRGVSLIRRHDCRRYEQDCSLHAGALAQMWKVQGQCGFASRPVYRSPHFSFCRRTSKNFSRGGRIRLRVFFELRQMTTSSRFNRSPT